MKISSYRVSVRERKAIKVVVCALALAIFLLPTATQAGTVLVHSRLKGDIAGAFFSSTDSTGCITTTVTIEVFDKFPSLMLISQNDSCTQRFLFSTFDLFTLTDSDFQVSNKLDSATLNTTISSFDFVSQLPLSLSIDLTWTCLVKPISDNSNSHFRSPNLIINMLSTGVSCLEANASGIVSDGTTNFTPETAVGSIQRVNEGTIEIFRP